MIHLNTITVSGFVADPPQILETASGDFVSVFRMRVPQAPRVRVEQPDMWLTVKCFGQQCEKPTGLMPGMGIAVVGTLAMEGSEESQGKKVVSATVVANTVSIDRTSKRTKSEYRAIRPE